MKTGALLMKLKSILIQNFRNINKEDLSLDKNFTLLIGKNGTGKTNILDAVALTLENVALKTDAITHPMSYLKKRTPISSSDIRRPPISRDYNKLEELNNNELLISGNFIFEDKTFHSNIR